MRKFAFGAILFLLSNVALATDGYLNPDYQVVFCHKFDKSIKMVVFEWDYLKKEKRRIVLKGKHGPTVLQVDLLPDRMKFGVGSSQDPEAAPDLIPLTNYFTLKKEMSGGGSRDWLVFYAPKKEGQKKFMLKCRKSLFRK